jgi:hypothetical protein
MYYWANVVHNSMAVHLLRSYCDGWVSAVYPMQWLGLMIHCGMTAERMGMLGVSVRKMKALTVKMETVTLIGKGR